MKYIEEAAAKCRDPILNSEMRDNGQVTLNFATQLKIICGVKANLILEVRFLSLPLQPSVAHALRMTPMRPTRSSPALVASASLSARSSSFPRSPSSSLSKRIPLFE